MTETPPEVSLDVMRLTDRACSRLEEIEELDKHSLSKVLAEFDDAAKLNETERSHLRRELICLDIELREKRGDPPQAVDYDAYGDPEFVDRAIADSLASDAADSRPPAALTRYQFGSLIGRGGIGLIWKVHDRETNRPLAMKMLRRRFRDHAGMCLRLRQEAWLTGMLQHPGIPPVHDVGSLADDSPYFTMKLVDGKTLKEILQSVDSEALSERLRTFEQVAQTMAYVHSEGVIHRDLKPSNVMVGQFGEIQVMDWGLAKKSRSSRSRSPAASFFPSTAPRSEAVPRPEADPDLDAALTQSGDVFGTPHYMSPEQARGDVDAIDERSDVFGLGAMLFEILTGSQLYEGKSSGVVIEKCIRADQADMLTRLSSADIPERLSELCKACISSDPIDRPENAGRVASEIHDYFIEARQNALATEVNRLSEDRVREEQVKRHRSIVGMTSTLAVVSLLAATGMTWQWRTAVASQEAAEMAGVRSQRDAEVINEVNDYLNQILTSTWPEKRGDDVTLRQVMDDTLPTLDGKFQERPRVEGFIRRTLGDTYRRLNEYEIANEQLRAALDAYRRVDPVDQTEVLFTMDRLAENLHFDGTDSSLDEAAQIRTEVLRRSTVMLGPTAPQTIGAMERLAAVMLDQEEYEKAEALLGEAWKLAQTTTESDAFDRLNILTLRSYAQANLEREIEAIAGYRKVRSDSSVTTAEYIRATAMLGEVLSYEDRIDEAIEFIQEAIQMSTSYFGAEHEITMDAEIKLVRLFDSEDRSTDAIAAVEATLQRHIENLDDDSGDVWELRQIKIRNLKKLGRNTEAKELLLHAHNVLREGRPGHRYTREAAQMLENFK